MSVKSVVHGGLSNAYRKAVDQVNPSSLKDRAVVRKPLGATCPKAGLLSAMLAAAFHGVAQAALPSPPDTTTASIVTPVAPARVDSDDSGFTWFLPPIRLGGSLAHNVRRSQVDDKTSGTSGQTLTLNAATSTYVWQPWFARVDGNLGFTTAIDQLGGINNGSSRNVVVTGAGALSLLAQSRFPFQAHFQRSDSRVVTDQFLGNRLAAERFGFSQQYFHKDGDVMLGWDRDTQHSADSGGDQGETLQLRVTQRIAKHNLRLAMDRSHTVHEKTGDQTQVVNLTLQHTYLPLPTTSVQNLLNASQSEQQQVSGNDQTLTLQLASTVFWRPEDINLRANAGLRLFSLENQHPGVAGNPNPNPTRNSVINANAGASYEVSAATSVSASVNFSQNETGANTRYSSGQQLGASYQPAVTPWGAFRYNWGVSGGLSHQAGSESSQRQLSLQFSHSLGRSIRLADGSGVSIDLNQGLAVTADSAVNKHVNHSASVLWNQARDSGSAMLRLSASDSRALDDSGEFFQLINFQAASNLPTSSTSSWRGNLTIQGSRQGRNAPLAAPVSTSTSIDATGEGFVVNSSGSIGYQNQRLFGVRRLRFGSDLRLNGQSFLPVLVSSDHDQLAVWESRVDYAIGRTQLRLNFVLSSIDSPKNVSLQGVETERVTRINRSIMFSIFRSFGDF